MKFDLDNFDSRKRADEGFELQLIDPTTSQPGQEFITVLGRDSQVWQDESDDFQRGVGKAMAKSGKITPLSPEERRAATLSILAACTVKWRGEKLGKIPFSKEAARALYTQYPAIYEQVDAAIADRANFLQGGSKNSSDSPATSSN